jgi:hypothetical protein
MPFRDFTVGQVLTSSQVDEFLMRQAVMVFDDSADRSASLGTFVAEGMVAYLKDIDRLQKYDGSNWGPVGEDAVLNEGEVGQNVISNGTAGIQYENSISPFLLLGV